MTTLPGVVSANNTDEQSDTNASSQYKILTLSFNQDGTALSMGMLKTYSLFKINQNNNFDEIHNCGIVPVVNIPYLPYEKVRILERLFSSSLIVLVSDQEPSRFRVFHSQKGIQVFTNVFPSVIVSIKLNRLRLVVCLKESIWIFNMRDMKVVHTIRDVPINHDGLCTLSSNDTNSDFAYPGSSTKGDIQIFDTINLKPGILINAHESPLAAMSFDMSGMKIATASTKGTVIRIHNAIDGSCLFEFRRGVRRVATIYSLAFSPDTTFLAASSNTGTVHIFRLMNQTEKTSEEANTWMGSFGRLVGGVAGYLPTQASEVLTQDRSFATVHLQSTEIKTTITMNIVNKKIILYVACYDGVVGIYEVNTNDGGECKQINQCLLFDISQKSNNQQSLINNDRQNIIGQTAGVNPSNSFHNDSDVAALASEQQNRKTS